jgi:hypothetical protein
MIKRIVLENDFSKVKIDSKDDISRYFKDFNNLDLAIEYDVEDKEAIKTYARHFNTEYDIFEMLNEIVNIWKDDYAYRLLLDYPYFINEKITENKDKINNCKLIIMGKYIFFDDSYFEFCINLDDIDTEVFHENIKVFGSEYISSIADRIKNLYTDEKSLLKDFKDELKKVLLNLN